MRVRILRVFVVYLTEMYQHSYMRRLKAARRHFLRPCSALTNHISFVLGTDINNLAAKLVVTKPWLGVTLRKATRQS